MKDTVEIDTHTIYNCNDADTTVYHSYPSSKSSYVGRLAPTPSGHMHVGHAQTFLIAMYRADINQGKLLMRLEDLDYARCKSHYIIEMFEDLQWMGIRWHPTPLHSIDHATSTTTTTTNSSNSCYSNSNNNNNNGNYKSTLIKNADLLLDIGPDNRLPKYPKLSTDTTNNSHNSHSNESYVSNISVQLNNDKSNVQQHNKDNNTRNHCNNDYENKNKNNKNCDISVTQSNSFSVMINSSSDHNITRTHPPNSSSTTTSSSSNISVVKDYIQQTDRMSIYKQIWYQLFKQGYLYPSPHSRKDIETSISAPHEGDEEVVFPTCLRPTYMHDMYKCSCTCDGQDINEKCICSLSTLKQNAQNAKNPLEHFPSELQELKEPYKMNWRFRIPDGRKISFVDEFYGPQAYICGQDFGDFIIWRGHDHIPSYEFAVVVDDALMSITEVVRGYDLLLSTARQILLYEALQWRIPRFYHCPLIRDIDGKRLAKRSPSNMLRTLRQQGYTPKEVIEKYFDVNIIQLLKSVNMIPS